MQVDLAASQPRVSILSHFRFDRLSNSSTHRPAAKFLMIALVVLQFLSQYRVLYRERAAWLSKSVPPRGHSGIAA